MIVRSNARSGFGGVTTLVVDPIVVTQSDGTQTIGPSGELVVGTPAPKASFHWWWLLAAIAGGLAVGWWLSGDSARRPLA